MSTPYRSDNDALDERKDSLEREIAQLKNQTNALEGLKAQQSDLERELAAVTERARAKRALPLLDAVRVATPCNASWDDMVGDERVRFCGSCEKNVYNLSAMPRDAAEQLLRERAGGEMCVRFYQRADGTMMTEDCPVGVKKKRRKKLALAVAGAGAMAVAALTATVRGTRGPTMMGAVAMGEMTPVDVKPVDPATPPFVEPPLNEAPPPQHVRMGSIAPSKVQPPKPPAPPHAIKMGKRAR